MTIENAERRPEIVRAEGNETETLVVAREKMGAEFIVERALRCPMCLNFL